MELTLSDEYPYLPNVDEDSNKLLQAYRSYKFALKAGDYFVTSYELCQISRNRNGGEFPKAATKLLYRVEATVPYWQRTEQGNFIYWMFVLTDLTDSHQFEVEIEGCPPFDSILSSELASILYGN